MKGLREKFHKNEGFTLVEMLIVVAIIAILIAVSIPMFSSNLDKARQAVDEANMRSAFGLASAEVLAENITTDKTWYYKVSTTAGSPTGELADVSTDAYKAQSNAYSGTLTVTYDVSKDKVTAEYKSTTP